MPLELEESFVENIRVNLPELPEAKRKRFVEVLGLSEYDASVLVAEKERADYFEAVIAGGADGKLSANWVNNELFGRLNKEGLGITESPVSPEQIAGLVGLITSNVISGKIAKEVFEIVWAEGGDPEQIVESRGMPRQDKVNGARCHNRAGLDPARRAGVCWRGCRWFEGVVAYQDAVLVTDFLQNDLQLGCVDRALGPVRPCLPAACRVEAGGPPRADIDRRGAVGEVSSEAREGARNARDSI